MPATPEQIGTASTKLATDVAAEQLRYNERLPAVDADNNATSVLSSAQIAKVATEAELSVKTLALQQSVQLVAQDAADLLALLAQP